MTKAKPLQLLVDAFKDAQPKNPALSGTDRAYLRGLMRRGFTVDEIIAIGAKAGVKVTADDLKPKTKTVAIKAHPAQA